LPGLRVVVTALAFGGLAMAASQSLLPSGAIDVMRKHVLMRFHPALIRAGLSFPSAA
jgi:hypothetical protein